MEKEQILKTLKDLIANLNDKRLKEDESFRKEWQRKQQEVGIAIKKLNSCDALWINDEYAKWFNAEVKPFIKDINPLIKDKLLWK